MNAASNVFLLPPPGAKRVGTEGTTSPRRVQPEAADQTTQGLGLSAEQMAGLVDALARRGQGPQRKRNFADEMVGETGRAPADLGFAAQSYAQETLHMAAHHEDWRQGTMAYMAAQNITGNLRGNGVAA
ncbi:MAG: hypothetical protein JNJ97_08035 [Alphaproteobacteria bacterium]|nr:hypothetical protein [Alphaproteobacteria bacterium]MCA0450617.1 hypothetical protein [Pseudomonadota bacterium]